MTKILSDIKIIILILDKVTCGRMSLFTPKTSIFFIDKFNYEKSSLCSDSLFMLTNFYIATDNINHSFGYVWYYNNFKGYK